MVKMTGPVARQKLADVPEGKQFWCVDGRTLKNLPELAASLEQMSEDTFRTHSNDTKSDFSNWVRDVIGEDKLARDLLKSSTKQQAAKAVADRVKWLKEKAGQSSYL
jgi:hypothetical protein